MVAKELDPPPLPAALPAFENAPATSRTKQPIP